MLNFNRLILMGNLTRDPELRYTSGNTPVCNIGLAINRRYRNGDGDLQEDVSFIDCEAWGSTGEKIAKYLTKGRPIHIEGRLKQDRWEDKEGNNRSKLKVVVERFQFVDRKPADGREADHQKADTEDQAPQTELAPATTEDDVPF